MQLNPMCLNGQVSFTFSEIKWAPSSVNAHCKGVFFFLLPFTSSVQVLTKKNAFVDSQLVFQPRLQHCKIEVMLHVCFWRRLCCWLPKFVIDWVIGNPLGYRCQHSAVFRSQFRVRVEVLGFSCSKLCFEMVMPLKWAVGVNFCCFGESILSNRNEVLNGRLFCFFFFLFSLKIPGF